jgi:hypothetical protein
MYRAHESSRHRFGPLGASAVNRAGWPRLGPDVFCDERHGLWIVVRPASSFILESVEERRAGPARAFGDSGWTAVDTLALVLIALFYGALGYVLWQLSVN